MPLRAARRQERRFAHASPSGRSGGRRNGARSARAGSAPAPGRGDVSPAPVRWHRRHSGRPVRPRSPPPRLHLTVRDFPRRPLRTRRARDRRLPRAAVSRRHRAAAAGRAQLVARVRPQRAAAHSSGRARFAELLHDRSGRLRRGDVRRRRRAGLRLRRRGCGVPDPARRLGHAVQPVPVDPRREPELHGGADGARPAHQPAHRGPGQVRHGARSAAARAALRERDPGGDAPGRSVALPRADRRRLRGADPRGAPGRRRLLRRLLRRSAAGAGDDRRRVRQGPARGAVHGEGADPAAQRGDAPGRRQARPAAADHGPAEPAALRAQRRVALRHHGLRAARHRVGRTHVRERRAQPARAGARRRAVRLSRRAAQPDGRHRRRSRLPPRAK